MTVQWLNPAVRPLGFMLVGVGGQGTILASDVIAEVGLELGYDVKKAEVHGMSQRGGSVTSHVRWGTKVYSPIVAKGEADILVAFEKSEAARYISNLRKDGFVLVSDYEIIPITVSSGGQAYPQNDAIRAAIQQFTQKNWWVDGMRIAEELGNTKVANVVILGALSALMEIEAPIWLEVIKKRVPPKFVGLNQKAFEMGRTAVN
jgi:indolepyruvate ferredoxin oxidoreductase, beta subunit